MNICCKHSLMDCDRGAAAHCIANTNYYPLFITVSKTLYYRTVYFLTRIKLLEPEASMVRT